MKIPPLIANNRKKFAALVVAAIILFSLVAWTAFSPAILSPQSEAALSNSLFRYTKSESIVNITDGEGSYSFIFGLDYNETVSPGSPTIVVVFASLLSEQKSGGFLKGVALQVVSSSVLIDGQDETGVRSMVTTSGGIMTDRLSGVDINDTGGSNVIAARLIISTVDVNYIGYLQGSEQAVTLNGTLTIV